MVNEGIEIIYPSIKICILAPLLQKLLALISKQASLVLLADAREKVSEVTGCKDGSVATLWQISVSREAVRSWTSFCLIVGNLPKGNTIAWSTEKKVPHWQVLDVLKWCNAITQRQRILKTTLVQVNAVFQYWQNSKPGRWPRFFGKVNTEFKREGKFTLQCINNHSLVFTITFPDELL